MYADMLLFFLKANEPDSRPNSSRRAAAQSGRARTGARHEPTLGLRAGLPPRLAGLQARPQSRLRTLGGTRLARGPADRPVAPVERYSVSLKAGGRAMASIVKRTGRKDGAPSYHVKYHAGDGRVRWERYGSAKEAKARKAEVELELARTQGRWTPPVKVTLREYAELWLGSRGPALRPSTVSEYRRILEREILPRFGHLPLAAITRSQLKAYAAASSTPCAGTPSTSRPDSCASSRRTIVESSRRRKRPPASASCRCSAAPDWFCSSRRRGRAGAARKIWCFRQPLERPRTRRPQPSGSSVTRCVGRTFRASPSASTIFATTRFRS